MRAWKSESNEYVLQRETVLHETAELAKGLLERWGLVAGAPGGEDSCGRAKLRLMTPEELVDRAFETAERFMAIAREKGLLLDVPNPRDEVSP